MNLKILKIFAILLLVAILGGLTWWLKGGGNSCLMYGTTYTLLKNLKIGEATYYLYRSDSGSHDKAVFISLTPEPLPEIICDYASIKTPIYSTDIETAKAIKKLSITQKPDGGFDLEPVYSASAPGAEPQDWASIPIEVTGGR